MRKRDKTIIAGAAAAFAVAVPGARSPRPMRCRRKTESQAVIDDAAKELGVEPSALSDALKHALENRIDEAVDAGRLTEEQGKELKERIDSADVPLVFGGVGPGDRWFGHGFGHFGCSLRRARRRSVVPRPRPRTSCAPRSRTARALPRSRRTRASRSTGSCNALVADAETAHRRRRSRTAG